MMHQKSLNVIATFAKHMICPKKLAENELIDLGELGRIDFDNYKFRHNSNNYKGDSESENLLSEIMEAISRKLLPNKKVIILLSDGKDSMTLALALSKLNVKCDTLTLLRDSDDSMKTYITDTCETLGHTAHFITVSTILKSFESDTFVEACKVMKHAVLDQGFLFFLFGLKSFFSNTNFKPEDYQFIDGLGNDEHLGYLPSVMQRRSLYISKLGFWKIKPSKYTELNWYIRSPAESHGDLSALACFFKFKDAFDLNRFFEKVFKLSDLIDFRSFSRGNFHDHQCMIEKTRVAAEYFGSSIIYPWTDERLSDFCFNLPIPEKYDLTTGINKLPLRKLLLEEIDWKQEKRGVDLYFDLELDFFISAIAKEIAPSWAIQQIMKSWFISADVKKRALLELLNLSGYMISIGYSHSDIEKLLGKN